MTELGGLDRDDAPAVLERSARLSPAERDRVTVLGGVFIVWPGITIGTVVALFSIYVFADAVGAVTRLFSGDRSTGDRVMLGLRAVIEVSAGVAALAYPDVTAGALTVLIGIYAIATGANEIAGSRALSRLGASGTGWLAVGGVLSILAGFSLVVWPSIGAVTLAVVFGAYLATFGLVLLISAAVKDEPATSYATR